MGLGKMQLLLSLYAIAFAGSDRSVALGQFHHGTGNRLSLPGHILTLEVHCLASI